MSDEMNKYPAHEEIKEQDHAYLYDPWGNDYCKSEDVLAEFQSLLAARQRDEEIMRELVGELKDAHKILHGEEWATQDAELLMNQINDHVETAINAAELRLKEGDNE